MEVRYGGKIGTGRAAPAGCRGRE